MIKSLGLPCAVALAASLALSGCNTTVPSVTVVTNDLSAIGKIISSDWTILTADAAPTACAVAESVSVYGQALLAAGQIANINSPATIVADLAAVAAIGSGTLCKTLMAGGTVSNPLTLITDIAQAIAAVEAATNGKVTAAAATAPTTSTPSVSRIGGKMAAFNDHLRFVLNGLKSTRYHY